ncbi:LysR substrate-binding domain-containing protein [Arthrobacter sp.]|uniref:LysR substrate-binding domain-containing protein n=1 Tax=Arthrobacter sp. TaxID=1667 RepID=UPI00289ACEA7|nr:LysR substrate-binding domain-containing protein [Arthrobacter sp.]
MDLNLLRTFVSVYETGSLTASARALFVTQPSVSHSLSRLRTEFGDALFIRSGGRMQPTALAAEIFPDCRDALVRLDSLTERSRSFDPATSTRRFRLCLSDLGELGFLPAVLRHLSEVAPGVELDVVPMDIALVADWLERGTVDAAIASWPLAGGFESVLLKQERYVGLLHRDFPLAVAGAISMEEFLAAGHVEVARSTGHQAAGQRMDELGIVRRTRVRVRHFSVLPQIVSESGLMAIVPESTAAGWIGRWPLQLVDLPFDVDPIEVRLHLPQPGRRTPALDWFGSMLRNALPDTL